ncbi:hypothetical protein VTN00DRAFT_3434 [Thermoascus crustaceus]|uniref:uncharacterized protein n=1 Tax=Thermoascus crustaceus TaxID=5088 RepID=UPI0037445852
MDRSGGVEMDNTPDLGMVANCDIEMETSDIEMDNVKLEVKGDDEKMDLTPNAAGKSRLTFMDLPQQARKLIYKYVHLLRDCTICITGEKSRTKTRDENSVACFLIDRSSPETNPINGWESTHGANVCDHPPLPCNLFWVSRAVREDAAITFFSHHRFKATLRNQMDLLTFFSATERHLQYIRILHVELHPYDYRSIKNAPGIHRSIYNLWVKFCNLVPARMTRLRAFSLKTRVKDAETAQKLVDAMDNFPLLNECALYFEYAPVQTIRTVARHAVSKLTSQVDPLEQPFRFRDLPKELQLMILRFALTVHWDHLVGKRRECVASAGYVTFQDRKRQRNPDQFPLICCEECTAAKMYCFCYPRQSAVSSHCVCFRSPVPYFLVDKEMFEDARDIFYSKNRFAFIEEEPEYMMRFLHNFPNETLRLIRHLTLKFPANYRAPGRPTATRSERSLTVSWSILIRFIKEHFDLERLTLIVADMGTIQSLAVAVEDRNKYLRRFLKLFTTLEGIHSFQVYLIDDPMYEEIAERWVMGDRYMRNLQKKGALIPFYGPRPLRQTTQS